MFDHNAMAELAALSRDRYQRNGGGGAHKVYNSSKAYYDAHGHNELSAWDRLVTETKFRWRQAAANAASDFKWDCHVLTLDRGPNGDIPF
jgi:hypothetical protein